MNSTKAIEKLLSIPVLLKIVKFFDENPHIIDTPDGVATFTGLETLKAKNALEVLANAKLLMSHRAPSAIGYSYTTDKATLKKIALILKKKGIMHSS